ncbi:MAG: LacI family DNA-binding transcriptional regulator [Acidobacteria bacterium]|nr:LacI family DNA-binding transcriptional regulator [Acidobacteriota bacterium]
MTLEQVAKRAGVSTATVSRVMNTPALVKEATRQRVLAAAKELHYRPNRYAQSLAGGRSRTLGVIVSNIENPFFLDILHSLEEVATERGFEVVYENTDYRPTRLAAAVDLMLARPLAGLAVIESERDEHAVRRLLAWDRPVVVSDLCSSGGNVTQIRMRYEKGMQRTVEYLHSLGHRRMAFVGHHGTLDPLREREHSFETTVRRFTDVQSRVAISADSPRGGRQAVNEILESGFNPTAVLCVNDFMAVGVLRELRDQGLEVPQDVSVTGFDNIELAEYLNPALTTANIPRKQIGRIIFDTLTPSPDHIGKDQEVLIDPQLVVRESTAKAKG